MAIVDMPSTWIYFGGGERIQVQAELVDVSRAVLDGVWCEAPWLESISLDGSGKVRSARLVDSSGAEIVVFVSSILYLEKGRPRHRIEP